MKKILLFVICCLFASHLYSQDVPASERSSLIYIYNLMGGANWISKADWLSTKPVESWYGITVEVINGQKHVTKIKLGANNLTGMFPNALVNLPYLKELYFDRNNIGTSIDLGSLSNLEILNLYNCNLNQVGIGNPKLISLDISQNSISSIINIGNLPLLQKLDISRNKFSVFPISIQNLVNLQSLDISENLFTGNLPNIFGNLTMLKILNMRSNKFSGSIANHFINLTNLEDLYLDSNLFTGNINLNSNSNLKHLYAGNVGDIKVMQLKNGSNSSLTYVFLENSSVNPNGIELKVKCVEVDNPTNAQNNIWPYSNWSIRWFNNIKNYQSDCSAFLGTENGLNQKSLRIVNPVKDIMSIIGNETIKNIEIFSTNGQLVKKSLSKETNVSDLEKGIYIVKIKTDNGETIEKIIKK